MTGRVEHIGDATLIHGDCREIAQTLIAGRFDLVLTDPPYGQGYVPRKNENVDRSTLRNDANFKPQEFTERMSGDDAPPDVDLIVSMGRDVIIWGGHVFHHLLPAGGSFLIWDKKEGGFKKWTGADAEIAWFSRDGAPRLFHHLWVGLIKKNQEKTSGGSNRGQFHPTEKPVALMEWCLKFLPQAETILDPFMGSGTTGVAASNLGRKFIGIEKDKRHFETAVKRIAEAQSQVKMEFMFRPEPDKLSIPSEDDHE